VQWCIVYAHNSLWIMQYAWHSFIQKTFE